MSRRNGMKESAALTDLLALLGDPIEYVILTCEEAEYAQDVKLAHSVGLKWPPRTKHDPQCAGCHPLTSYNGLVEYPCPH